MQRAQSQPVSWKAGLFVFVYDGGSMLNGLHNWQQTYNKNAEAVKLSATQQ